jgi:hypothetical protein
MIRHEIAELLQMEPLPCEQELIQPQQLDRVKAYEMLLHSITKPVTDEEAKALTTLFGIDGCFGLGWTLLHLIETAPNWPIDECLMNPENEWIERLRNRAERWRAAGSPGRSTGT